MICLVNAFAKLSTGTAKSASFDDIRKGNVHSESFHDKKGFTDKLSAECDQQFYLQGIIK
jgi:hypothetical protein